MNAIQKYNAIRDATHAEIVAGLINRHDIIACSLASGYMVTRDCGRIIFSDHYGDRCADAPRESDIKRNKDGRCTGLVATYSDGSRLRFTWSQERGARYRVLA